MKFILAKKENMVSFIGEDGHAIAATLLSALPAVITQIKTKEADGYDAIQIGSGARSAKHISKAVSGHVKDLGSFEVIREFRVPLAAWKKGDTLDASVFSVGDKVAITGTSKGKGFQGVVKRHGFHGGPRTHGQKHSEREPGSIGGGGRAGGRVAKGMRMAGRMGSDRVLVKSLRVLGVDTTNGKLLVSGCVPGHRETLVEVRGE